MTEPQDSDPVSRVLDVMITFLLALAMTGPMFLFFAWVTPEPDNGFAAFLALAQAAAMTATRRWTRKSRLLKHLATGQIMAFLGCYVTTQMGLLLTRWSWVVGDDQTIRRPAMLLPLVPAIAAAVAWPALRRRFGGRKEE